MSPASDGRTAFSRVWWLFLTAFIGASVWLALPTPSLAQKTAESKLLIAFGSYRDRPKHPNIYFYEHDGVSKGEIAGKVGTPRNVANAEGHPSLSADGR